MVLARRRYFEFRQIFAQAEKSGAEGGWGRLPLHLRRKLAAQREFLEGAMRAAGAKCPPQQPARMHGY